MSNLLGCFIFLLLATVLQPSTGTAAGNTSRRIVSLAPSITETVFALQRGSELVGVTKQCDFPPSAKEKSSVGDLTQPNLERIISLRPTIVLVNEMTPRPLVATLRKLKVEILEIAPQRVVDVPATVELLGQELKAPALAQKIAADIRKEIVKLENKAAERQKRKNRKALVLVQLSPPIAAGGNTWLGDLIARAGFENMAANQSAPWPKLSQEFLLTSSLSFLFVDAQAAGESGTTLDSTLRHIWPASQKRPLTITLPADILMRPGPRLVEGLRFLSQQSEW